MVIKKEIVYPVFLECCKFTTDIYWENIFEYLAYEKCPSGCYISNDALCCNYKKKEFNYKIDNNKHPQIIYNEVYNLFSTKLGLMSLIEKNNKINEINNKKICEYTTWSSIRKKNIKDMLIEMYVLSCKKKYNLSFKDSRDLLSIIYVCILLRIFLPSDIILSNGKISKIKNLEFKDSKFMLKKNIFDMLGNYSQKDVKNELKYLSSTWDKYISSLYEISNSICKNTLDDTFEETGSMCGDD